jgi:integrase
VRGSKKEARRELIRLLAEIENGTAIDPSRITVAEYIRGWLDNAEGLAGKTRERYGQLAEQQIIPHLGGIVLQKLRPVQIADWHGLLLRAGGKDGRALSARTVGHAHRLLRAALERAATLETVGRNVAAVVRLPKVDPEEVEILSSEQIAIVLGNLRGHALYPIVATALGTGMRRSELCGLQWGDLDLNAARVNVERSMEETAEGLRLKPPKTRNGRRTISLPAAVKTHRVQQLTQRVRSGSGAHLTRTWFLR